MPSTGYASEQSLTSSTRITRAGTGVGIALGALWEVAEWGFDQIAPGDVIKGKHDTIIDIVMDTAGALLAGILALWLARWPPGTGGGSR